MTTCTDPIPFAEENNPGRLCFHSEAQPSMIYGNPVRGDNNSLIDAENLSEEEKFMVTRFRIHHTIRSLIIVQAICSLVLLSGCFFMRGSDGGGNAEFKAPRVINPDDVALPEGFRIEPVTAGLTFPTGVAFDDDGIPYVVESGYAYGEVWETPRLLRVEPSGKTTVIATGGENGPWNGVDFHDGFFYVAEGGQLHGGRILRISMKGEVTVMIDSLPSFGDHHTNGPAVGPDGWIYFGQGTATNSGVVGDDNFNFGWLKRFPDFHDIPAKDIVLTGENFETDDLLRPGFNSTVKTGAFLPYGTPSRKGQVIPGKLPCTGAVMKISAKGGKPELVAWGLRNPFGLAFSGRGELYVSDNMYDDRGSRPVHGAGDLLWKIEEGRWYGWPDFHGTYSLNDGDHYEPSGGADAPAPLLESHPNPPQEPVAILAVHSSSNGLDFSSSELFGYVDQAFIAQFGDQAPVVGKVISPVGFKVVRVDVNSGVVYDFAVNKGKHNGPASWIGGGGFERPVAVRFTPDGSRLYVVDFGLMLNAKGGVMPQKQTGILWQISPSTTTMR